MGPGMKQIKDCSWKTNCFKNAEPEKEAEKVCTFTRTTPHSYFSYGRDKNNLPGFPSKKTQIHLSSLII
jgi:hypothetical protein